MDKKGPGCTAVFTPDWSTPRTTHMHGRSAGMDRELQQGNDHAHANSIGDGHSYQEAQGENDIINVRHDVLGMQDEHRKQKQLLPKKTLGSNL